jgi:hypothetical protein
MLKKSDISPFVRDVEEMRYLPFREKCARNKSRLSWEMWKKCDISPFVRDVQEMRHLALLERCGRNTKSRGLVHEYKYKRGKGRAKTLEVLACVR